LIADTSLHYVHDQRSWREACCAGIESGFANVAVDLSSLCTPTFWPKAWPELFPTCDHKVLSLCSGMGNAHALAHDIVILLGQTNSEKLDFLNGAHSLPVLNGSETRDSFDLHQVQNISKD
jgi:hypothetical protein